MRSYRETFTSYDGLTIGCTFACPDDETKAYVLLVHGITSERDESGFYSRMAEAFASSGIGSLRFEYRSHGESELPSKEMTLSGIVNDIDGAFHHMKSKANSEGCAAFAVGTSFGGGLTAYWAARNSSALKGLFLCAPVIDYEDDIHRNTDDWRNCLANAQPIMYAGVMEISRALLNEMPFINGISALRTPSLPIHIFHGVEDRDVPLSSSTEYEGRAGMVWLNRIAGVGHGFGAPGDEDFETAETAANHDSIYRSMISVIRQSAAE